MKTIENLTKDQQAVNFETMRHIEMVRNLLNDMVCILLWRGRNHDQSKLKPPEVELFTDVTHRLSKMTYDSPEYHECKQEIKPALDHHYAHNRHHPEHFKNGVDDMNLIDLVEMFCDWKAASTRHHDGNLRRSIEVNGKRFNMSSQLIRIFENSIDLLESES